MEQHRSSVTRWFFSMLFFLFTAVVTPASAEDTICARVKIEIAQELSLERQGFDAHMSIANALTNITLENVAINVTFADEDGLPILATSDPNNTSAAFFIRIDSMTGITDVSGGGTVLPSTTADIHWLIVPAPGSAGELPAGKLYTVGASLTYVMGGKDGNLAWSVPDARISIIYRI